MREHYPELLAYVQEIENKYETTVIKKYLSGDIIVRQLAYYLNTTDGKATKMAKLYAMGRYELTNRKNYWEVKR